MVQGLGQPGWTCSGIEAEEWRGRECPEVAENVGEISRLSPGSGFGLGHVCPDLLGARGSR